MNAADFLREVLPEAGLYCIAWPVAGKEPGSSFFLHKAFDEIPAAALFATVEGGRRGTKNIYFTPHSHKGLVEAISKSGQTFMRVKRSQDNMRACRCFYVDIDCGPKKAYKNKREGAAALARFCAATGLPVPMVVSSGNGLHCYWLLTRELDSLEWRRVAEQLKALCIHHGFEVDHAITADSARVLRVVGTYNRKDPNNPLKVEVRILQAERIDTAWWIGKLEAESVHLPIAEVRQFTAIPFEDLPTPKAVAEECATFNLMASEAATARGVVWMNTNLLCLHTKGGPKLAHKLAAKHPDYVFEKTQAKIDRMLENKQAPTTCGTLERLYPGGAISVQSPCPSCKHYGRPGTSPVVIARNRPKETLPAEIPPPALPYLRTKRGVEYQPPVVDGEPQKPNQLILTYDFYPTGLYDEQTSETKTVTWLATLPFKGLTEIKLPISIYTNEDQMMKQLAERGVVIDKRNAKLVGGYMSHYIKQLQLAQEERKQFESLGWNPDHTEFGFGDVTITKDGPKPSVLSSHLSNLAPYVRPGGSMAKQIELLRFYNFPEYRAQQFMIALSLGAPLLFMTNLYGLICNGSGPSGASKTTALMAASGLYGRPDRFMMGAGEDDATAQGRAGRIRMLANLPACIDEITLLDQDQLKRLVMAITQPTAGKIRAGRMGGEQGIPDTAKSTVMLSTSNNSTHYLLSFNNPAGDAGSKRILEFKMKPANRHTKTEGDAFLKGISENYGHISPVFIDHVIKNRAAVEAELAKVRATVDFRGGVQPSERFWSAAIAVAIVALRIANRLGLLSYDADALLEWAIGQLDVSRRTVRENYSSPLEVLQTYIQSIAGSMLVVTRGKDGVRGTEYWAADPARRPQILKARLEPGEARLYLSVGHFRAHCQHIKQPYDAVRDDLIERGVMTSEKMDLGRHIPEYSAGGSQGRTLRVNLNHELMADMPATIVDGDNVVELRPKKVVDKDVT